ncbi:MAG TPA: hypothetical protein VHW72_09775, partial [Candidatus Angelobacter sp.]|nr:hypothetical protein [Candidatus Angelobacter sp.]
IAKVAGEGPRWNCVRQLAAGGLQNSSKFYTRDPTGGFFYITFKTLWASWDSVFGALFNIPDLTVRQALLNPATRWGGDGRQHTAAAMGGNDYSV